MQIIRLGLFILLLFIFACESPVIFTDPQPVDTRTLNQFPKKLHGSYQVEGNESYLKIDANSIQRIHLFRIDTAELDENIILEQHYVYDKTDNISYPVKSIHDTLYIFAIDTFLLLIV